MDLDSIITLLFLFFFFVLPGILKRFRKKQKPAAPVADKPKKRISAFGGLVQKLQQFIRQIEEQAQQQRQAQQTQETQDSHWDDFMEDETDSSEQDTWDTDDWDTGTDTAPSPEIEMPEPAFSSRDRSSLQPRVSPSTVTQYGYAIRPFRSSPLQNAVIWAEILGKPVGLKNFKKNMH